jgi:fructose 1,6-bisphosphatase
MKVTISVIKADTGSVGGHNKPSQAMLDKAKERA